MRGSKPELIKIGETYIKFNYDFSEFNKSLIKEIYLKEVSHFNKENFNPRESFKISIEYDKGSLKTRIILWGTIVFTGIANYGSFRDGVRELINDSRIFSEFVIESVYLNNIQDNDIIRSEVRSGLPGRIQDIYNRIDKLERDMNNLSNNEIGHELNQIKQEVANIIEVLPLEDSHHFLAGLSDDYRQNLPQPNGRRTNYLLSRYALKPDDEIEFLDE